MIPMPVPPVSMATVVDEPMHPGLQPMTVPDCRGGWIGMDVGGLKLVEGLGWFPEIPQKRCKG